MKVDGNIEVELRVDDAWGRANFTTTDVARLPKNLAVTNCSILSAEDHITTTTAVFKSDEGGGAGRQYQSGASYVYEADPSKGCTKATSIEGERVSADGGA